MPTPVAESNTGNNTFFRNYSYVGRIFIGINRVWTDCCYVRDAYNSSGNLWVVWGVRGCGGSGEGGQSGPVELRTPAVQFLSRRACADKKGHLATGTQPLIDQPVLPLFQVRRRGRVVKVAEPGGTAGRALRRRRRSRLAVRRSRLAAPAGPAATSRPWRAGRRSCSRGGKSARGRTARNASPFPDSDFDCRGDGLPGN